METIVLEGHAERLGLSLVIRSYPPNTRVGQLMVGCSAGEEQWGRIQDPETGHFPKND